MATTAKAVLGPTGRPGHRVRVDGVVYGSLIEAAAAVGVNRLTLGIHARRAGPGPDGVIDLKTVKPKPPRPDSLVPLRACLFYDRGDRVDLATLREEVGWYLAKGCVTDAQLKARLRELGAKSLAAVKPNDRGELIKLLYVDSGSNWFRDQAARRSAKR